MNITEKLRGAMRRIAGVSSAANAVGKRRTVALPSILNTYGPRADALPKPTPVNLRRFSETPVARKAINTIKDRIAGMRWRIQARPGRGPTDTDDAEAANADSHGELSMLRIQMIRFVPWSEQVLEDVIVGGFGAIEVETTGDAQQPLVLWPVDGATIRMKTDWDGLPGSPRYVQVTASRGRRATSC